MKKIILISSLLLFTGLKKDDLVEVENFLNARDSASFFGKANIRATLSKGTKGKIAELKKLPSGNLAVKLEIQNGKLGGKEFWVYYNNKNPGFKVISGNKKIEVDNNTINTRDLASLRDPEDATYDSFLSNLDKINKVNSDILSAPNKPCPPILSSEDKKASYDETMSIPPFKEVADSALHSVSCRTVQSGYDVCKSESGMIESFKLNNKGPNKIIKTNEYYIGREFDFQFDDQARSDMKLLVSDAPDDRTSHATYSVMLFFPRTVLPSIKKVDDVLEVTLPNKEVIKYNANTKEVIGGVFSESSLAQESNGKAKPPGLTYNGNGVLIRASKSGDLPYGDIEDSTGKTLPSNSIATVSKKGFKDCNIPSKDLWYTDNNKGGNVFLKREFSSDAGLDEFIKKRCGFSLF